MRLKTSNAVEVETVIQETEDTVKVFGNISFDRNETSISEFRPRLGEKGVIYGPEGVGKSTWAAGSESPIFISIEGGLKGVKPVPRIFNSTKTWEDIFSHVEYLTDKEHEFKTLVVDTIDKGESMSVDYVLRQSGKKSLSGIPHGNGYVMLDNEWRKLINAFDILQEKRGMNIILIGHSVVVPFKNPAGEDYDRYQMLLNKRIYPMIKQWADFMLFANHRVLVDIDEGQTKGKAISASNVIYATHSGAWDAKNRYGITEPLQMPKENGFQEFWKYVKGETKNETK